ncbi:hypothetical protein [Micromonospora sp. WMMD1155]|uniref:hypothetical protein n=1 Tax=Micromonospora sp. WMMD1155 TaxID=3016094 RepID=UPI00249A66E7|nr:hypothetical protein [Micromonospora sp. WMMD1155]WFE52183.1 hypothetical protein O7617_18440 [Micromonospora sp. WMMD1155]
MRTLPTPPVCGEPATVRIELYTADSLDACAYTCPAHTIHVTAVATKAGMNAQPVGMAPDVERPCGYVHVFPTGTLATEPADPSHPRWCDRGGCDHRGRHRSPNLILDTNRPESSIVEMALVQALHSATGPMVSLTSMEGDAAAELRLSLGQARVLRYRLVNLFGMAMTTSNDERRT